MLRRDVRERLRALYPFFEQGTELLPVAWRDSLYWAVHLYAVSEWFPLSQELRLGDRPVRYLRHAAVALVNSHTGLVRALAGDTPDPVTASWVRRFPELFLDPAALDPDLAHRLPPAADDAVISSLAFALVGVRGEYEPPAHLPRPSGDTLFSLASTSPYFDRGVGTLSVALPLLDPAERLRGVVAATGGARPHVRWIPLTTERVVWPELVDRLQQVGDSLRHVVRNMRIVHGPVRIVPSVQHTVGIQTHYLTRPDGTPQVLYVSVAYGDTVAVGTSIMGAAGMPLPTVVEPPPGPEAFRARVESLYAAMREALRRGDWTAFGIAYDALGRLLRTTK
jgi:uncharacterized membrane protein (UPF0182 family)